MATLEAVDQAGGVIEPMAFSSFRRDRPPRIPIARYPYIRTSGPIDFEINRVDRFNRGSLRRRVLPFEEQFEYEDPIHTRGKVIHFVQDGKEVVFARTQGPDAKDIGVVTQEVKDVVVGDQALRLLLTGIRVVLPEYQEHGVATGLAIEGITRHVPDIATGQTRVWGIIRMHEKTGFVRDAIFPIDGPIPDLIKEALRLSLDKSILNRTDLVRGVSLGAVPPAPCERFVPPPNHVRANEIWRRMLRLGIQPSKGDVVRYAFFTNLNAVYETRVTGDVSLVPSPIQPIRTRFVDRIANDVIIAGAYWLASKLPGARPR